MLATFSDQKTNLSHESSTQNLAPAGVASEKKCIYTVLNYKLLTQKGICCAAINKDIFNLEHKYSRL